jgi:ferrous iron transport protein B
MVVALNMSDIAESRGIKIDVDKISRALGVPVVPIVASKERGLAHLKTVIASTVANGGTDHDNA